LILARSSLALKKRNGLEIGRNFFKLSCAAPSDDGPSLVPLDGPERSPL
jgi:hypothetical protein